jgi:hypothetical protein
LAPPSPTLLLTKQALSAASLSDLDFGCLSASF